MPRRLKVTKYRVKISPTPRCCPEMKASRLVTLQIDVGKEMKIADAFMRKEGDPQALVNRILEAGPQWVIVDFYTFRRRDNHLNRARVEVKLCPFCSKKMPGFRLKKTIPSPICVSDGNYCLTCKNRLPACHCSDPMSAFEPHR